MGIQKKDEETRGDIAAASRSLVLQDPAASRNGCAVLHLRSGRSGAPSPDRSCFRPSATGPRWARPPEPEVWK